MIKTKDNLVGQEFGRLQAEKEYFEEFAPQRHLFKEYGIEDDFSKEE